MHKIDKGTKTNVKLDLWYFNRFMTKRLILFQNFEFLYMLPVKEYESELELCRQITNNLNK